MLFPSSFTGVETRYDARLSMLEAGKQNLWRISLNEHRASSFQFRYQPRQRQPSIELRFLSG
jgi:hypothetical protein